MAKFIVTLVVETFADRQAKPHSKRSIRDWTQTALDQQPNGWPDLVIKKARVRTVDLD